MWPFNALGNVFFSHIFHLKYKTKPGRILCAVRHGSKGILSVLLNLFVVLYGKGWSQKKKKCNSRNHYGFSCLFSDEFKNAFQSFCELFFRWVNFLILTLNPKDWLSSKRINDKCSNSGIFNRADAAQNWPIRFGLRLSFRFQ